MNGDTFLNILVFGLLLVIALFAIYQGVCVIRYVRSGEYEADLRLNSVFQALENAKK